MSIIQKFLLGASSLAVLGIASYFVLGNLPDSQQDGLDSPDNIVVDYKELLSEAEQLQMFVGTNCDNKEAVNKKIQAMEKKLADLAGRKKQWLDNVPKLPDVEPELVGEVVSSDNPLGRPGSEVPELSSNVPPLPEIDIKVLGSEVPELTSNVPPLPEIDMDSIVTEYIPEMPEINTGRPGSEVPELTSNVPPLPEINEADIIDPNENIFQMAECEQKIDNILKKLKALCEDETKEPVKKVVSDKCADACQRYKDCSSYTEDVTATDLNDAYNTCMEECVTWPKEVIRCINTTDIKAPNDCVSFVQCQLPQFYEETYLK